MSERYFAADRDRRSRLEVKIDILRAISEGISKQSHIIHRSNVSWSMAQNFIHKLEQQGLIAASRTKGRKVIVITERGKRVLDSYTSIIKQFELDVPLPGLTESSFVKSPLMVDSTMVVVESSKGTQSAS